MNCFGFIDNNVFDDGQKVDARKGRVGVYGELRKPPT